MPAAAGRRAVRAQPVAGAHGVLRFITAGSVDDGKSTLIGRLLHDTRAVLEDQFAAVARASERRGARRPDLSLLTDGLEAEREQGITIDVAYRYFATAARKFIIADTPGHEQYTRNMVTGASTADAAVILVDATKGLLPQSRRHLLIAHLLGIRHVIVAVNKIDLAGWSPKAFDAVRGDFAAFAAPLAIPDLRFIPLSALEGDMVVERGERLGWYAGPTLLEALEAIEVADDAAARPLRFPVQWVARPGEGSAVRALAGRVASGTVRVGDPVVVLPSGRRTSVKEIRTFDTSLESAGAGESVALVLADDLDASRGDLVASASHAPASAKLLRARLAWLSAEAGRVGEALLLRHGTRTVKARIASVDSRLDIHTLERRPFEGGLAMNDLVHASLVAQQALFVDRYDDDRANGAFVLIDPATHQTVAAGMVE